MKEIIINSQHQKTYAYNLIKEMPLDGTCLVITKLVDKSSTYKQQKLWFIWCGEVSNSGLGADDNKLAVHIRAKWMFVRLILLRDDELFKAIYDPFMEQINDSACKAEYCQGFSDSYIRTNKLTMKQRAESLTEFKKYWLDKGVNLTDPNDLGKNLLNFR